MTRFVSLLVLCFAQLSTAHSEEGCAEWLRKACDAMLLKHGSAYQECDGFGANDTLFLPNTNSVEEIFQQCRDAAKLPESRVRDCHAWLKAQVDEMQDLKVGDTRGAVLKVVDREGGMSSRRAEIFRLKTCWFLKVRIAFTPKGAKDAYRYDDGDVVSHISKPYLGVPRFD